MSLFSWYPHYVGDYQRKTAHLTILEHGAYRLLMDNYYSTGEPLPDNEKQLFRICRAFDEEEQAAIKKVLQLFFKHDAKSKQYTHERIQKEIAKKQDISEKRAQAAKNKGKNSSAKAKQKQSKSKAKGDTSTFTSTSTYKQPQPQDLFELFWMEFPRQRRGSKDKAQNAYLKATQRATEQKIYDGLQKYRQSDEVAKGYAKGAAAWLNDDRWANEYKQSGNFADQVIREIEANNTHDGAMLCDPEHLRQEQRAITSSNDGDD